MTQSFMVNAEPTKIMNDVWRVGGGSWNGAVAPLSAESDGNVFLLHLPDAQVLVDCGTHAGRAAIDANLAQLDVSAEVITDLILTHSHWDHTESAPTRQRQSPKLMTHAHALAAQFLADGDHRLVGYQMYGATSRFTPFRVDHAVSEEETFQLGGSEVETHYTPGHTADSMLYVIAIDDRRVGIVGDVLFAPRGGSRAVLGHLSRLWLSDLDAYVSSLRRLAQIPLDVVLPGHGQAIVGPAAIKTATRLTLRLAESLAADPRVRENFGV